MGKISSGDGSNLPYVPKDISSSKYVEMHFTFLGHQCKGNSLCRILRCDLSWTWIDGKVPSLQAVDKVLGKWSAYRNRHGNDAKKRQEAQYRDLTKKKCVEGAFDAVARLTEPFKDLTLLCDWNQPQISEMYDKVARFLGSTVLVSKTLYFLVPDLFVILDRGQSYRPLSNELNAARGTRILPRRGLIDRVDGGAYVELMSYVRDEIKTLLQRQQIVTLRDDSTQAVTTVNDFRALSPRLDSRGNWRPGTICKVVDDFFPTPGK